MYKIKLLSIISFAIILFPTVKAEVKKVATHSHNGRSHTHVLPKEGVDHNHGGSKRPSQINNKPSKNNFNTNKCDLLAAHPNDLQKKGKGVPIKRINVSLALPACKDAIQRYPNVARFKFQYGRVLLKLNKIDNAISWFKKSSQQGHELSTALITYLITQVSQPYL